MLYPNRKLFLSFWLIILIFNISFGQCTTTNLSNQGVISPDLTLQNTNTINSNKPYWQFNAVAGCEYTFTTCGNTSLDTYLRLYEDGAVGSWGFQVSNDDDCSYQSTITWIAPANNTYNILLTEYSCADLNSNVYLTYSSNCAAGGTCFDGIQNQGETGVDCGGPCLACPASCIDGIQNQNETGIDCGGVCPACPTCSDGIMNGDETGVDCGGSCPPCPVLCANIGFENMATNANAVDVTDWTLLYGRNNVAGPYTIENPTSSSTNCGFTAHPGCGSGIKVYNANYEHHDIKDANPNGDALQNPPPLPNLLGSNSRCIRLGQNTTAFSEAAGMTTTFTVTEPYLAYHYILRFNNTGHTINNRGFATLQIKDNIGTVLPCGSFEMYENGPGESWVYSNNGNGGWIMDEWKTLVVDVSPYMGQNLTIEVWVADCQEGAHAGWGYFDFECLPSAISDCSVAPLPVELSSFKSDCIQNQPTLLWTTASEHSNDYFTISHSIDGHTFTEVGTIDGAGNSQATIDYSWIADDVITGETNYFQLSQTDLDGETEFFDVIVMEECAEGKTSVYLDRDDYIHVLSQNPIFSVQLLDATGRTIDFLVEPGKHCIIQKPLISTGVYLIKITHLDQTVETRKLSIR